MRPVPRWLKRTLWGVGIATVLFVGVVGFAHTPWGRPLLPYLEPVLGVMPAGAGCPMGFDQPVEPGKAEAFRQDTFRQHLAGGDAAKSTRALGFDLGKTDKATVQAWVTQTGATCVEKREGAVIACSAVSGEAVGGLAIDDAFLQFDLEQRLVAVDIFRTATAEAAMERLMAIRAELDQAIGKATQTHGEFNPAFIQAGAMRRTSAEYKYRQYNAQLSVMNYGKGRIRLREQYQWVPATETASK